MLAANIATSVRQISPAVSIIDIQGAVTMFAEQSLVEAYGKAASPITHTIILNFDEMEYICGGIGSLVALVIRARRQQRRLLAFGLSEHYYHIFSLTRLSKAISIHQCEDEALASAC